VDRVLAERVLTVARAAGLEHVGLCDAEPFVQTRAVLEQRRDEGLSGGMQFTYRSPERSTDPSRTLPDARSLVVAALGYAAPVPPAGPGPQGRVARYATRDHYAVLRSALEQVADLLRAEGHTSRVLVDDNALVDRAAAVRAGLGWYGKSANVLLPGHGSWFVLGSVLTEAALCRRPAPQADGCGGCTRCLDGCPTGAIVAPGVVDARRCLAWLVQADGELPHEFREALDDRVYGCDECQEVCPPSRREEQRRGDAEDGTAQRSWVDLVWMLSAPDDELMGELGRWYVPRRDPRYLRRNALVALGNSVATRHRGYRHDEAVEAVLVRHLDGDDELLASHATWAALRMDRHDLVRTPARMARPAVRAELDRWPDGPGRGETGRR
jgi:epoxyqueuosine reductase